MTALGALPGMLGAQTARVVEVHLRVTAIEVRVGD